MDLGITETQALLQKSARELFKDKYPLSAVRTMDTMPEGISRDLWQDFADLGWTGLAIPEEWGGQGGSLIDLAFLYEEFGRACLPLVHLASSALCGFTILEAGNDDQKREFLRPIAEGSQRWAAAITEQSYAWTPESIETRATQSGSGYRLQGAKYFVPFAAGADNLLVAARTGGAGADGITLFVVEGDAPGVSTRRVEGWFGDALALVQLDDVQVDASRVIGQVGQGWAPFDRAMDKSLAMLCAYIAGALQQAFEMTADYGRGRKQFGVPIGSFQRVQDRIIELLNQADGARWTTYEAIWKLETGQPDAREALSVAKMVASKGFTFGMEEAHHVFAGYGGDIALGLWQYTRKSRNVYYLLGDVEHHRERLSEELAL